MCPSTLPYRISPFTFILLQGQSQSISLRKFTLYPESKKEIMG